MKKLAILMCFTFALVWLSATLAWDNAVAIRQGVNIEWFRTGVETNDGGAIFVWSDTKLGERDLWAQKVDAAGNMVWGDPLLIDGKPDRQEDPVITRTSDNNYVIAWIDFSADLDGDVYAQKINNQGQLLWQTGGKPVCTNTGVQISLNMEADNNGGVFIVWVDDRNPSKDLFGQRLNSSGNPVWLGNGIAIADGMGDEIQNTMLPDGQGGMIIAYTHSYVGEDNLYAKRFDASGNMVWANPLTLSAVAGSQTNVRMAALSGGDFVFTWQDQRNTDPDIFAQKINLNGQPQWGEYAVVYSDQNGLARPQLNPRIVDTSDNGVIIVWEDNRLDTQNPDLFAQKMSAAGTRLWTDNGIALCTAEFAQIGPRLAADTNGGCYVVWDDLRNGNSPNDDIYAQHLSSTGVALWDANGKGICTAANQQTGSLVKYAGNTIYVCWMDLRNGSAGIDYQALNEAGTVLLEPNGKQVFWGLSGDTPKDNYLILPRSNDSVIVWQDTRFANDGYRIYFQFLNNDGSVDLETNGRPVTTAVGGEQKNPHAVVTPDDQIAVVWEDARGNNPKVYAQLLSATGDRLWGDTGLELTNSDPLRQKDPKIGYYNGSFYIGWSNSDQINTSFFYHVYGQRIQNGQKMWGPDGVMISTLPTNFQNNECTLFSLENNYYVWHRVNPSENSQTIWVKRVNESGGPDTGWLEEGLKASTYSTLPVIQLLPKTHITPEGIFVMWKDLRNDFILNYWGQHISAAGTRLWDPLGVDLADNQREQEKPAITANASGITFVWCENINGMHDIMGQKYSLSGNVLWNPQGYYVVQKDSTQSNPTLINYGNGGYLSAWTDFFGIESDIYYRFIRENGEMVSQNTGGDILCNAGKQQYDPMAAPIGSTAYVVWADGRSSGKTEILGLYAQRVNNEVGSAVEDNTSPALTAFNLKQNHPNPFNPSTTISFSLKQNSPALELNIYNLKGQKVKNLFSGKLEKGDHSLVWDGKDESGLGVGSGIYFYRLSDGKNTQQRKMILMK